MNNYVTGCTAALLVAAPVLAAPKSLPDETRRAFDAYLALPDMLLPVLQTAKDQASADKAATQLHNVLPRVYEARTALQNLPDPTPEARAELERVYGKRAQEKWGAVYREIFRLQKAQCYGSTALAREFNILCMMLR